MSALKNWLLPILLAIAGFLTSYFGLIEETMAEFGIEPKWKLLIKLVLAFVMIAIAKLQPPSLKKHREAKLGYHPKN